MRQPRIVKHQKTRVIQSRKDFKGERSPYWDHVRENGNHNEEGELIEDAQANPDQLSTDSLPTPTPPTVSVGDVSRQLSGQQKKVFELYVDQGKSEKEIGIILKIGEVTVRTYLRRIREKFGIYV